MLGSSVSFEIVGCAKAFCARTSRDFAKEGFSMSEVMLSAWYKHTVFINPEKTWRMTYFSSDCVFTDLWHTGHINIERPELLGDGSA